MKILLLAITIILLLMRIKNTPMMLSKTLYLTKCKELSDNLQKKISNTDKDALNITKGFFIIFLLIFSAILILYYILVGCRISTNIVIILSAIQIVTELISTKNTLSILSAEGFDFKDQSFHRLYFLFNVILDYIYYPLTIYMLLK